MKAWKIAILYVAFLLVISMIFGAIGCNTVRKSQTSLTVKVDSSHIDNETHDTGTHADSSGHSSERGDYVRETVIEEFMPANDHTNTILADTVTLSEEKIPESVLNIPNQPTNIQRVIKRTIIKETGNYLKDQSVQVAKKDTSSDYKNVADDVKKDNNSSSFNKQSSRFPWDGIAFWAAILVLIGIVIFSLKKIL